MTDPVRARLDREVRRTRERIAALTRDFDDIVARSADASRDDEHDPEGATIAFERAQVSALLADARTREAELAAARRRLDEGAYGVCERCGRAIPSERLEARPTARTCVGCR